MEPSLPLAPPVGYASQPALSSVRENFSRPSGTRVSLPLFPALKRRAIGRRPSGAGFFYAWFHQTVRERVLTHTLSPYAGSATKR